MIGFLHFEADYSNQKVQINVANFRKQKSSITLGARKKLKKSGETEMG